VWCLERLQWRLGNCESVRQADCVETLDCRGDPLVQECRFTRVGSAQRCSPANLRVKLMCLVFHYYFFIANLPMVGERSILIVCMHVSVYQSICKLLSGIIRLNFTKLFMRVIFCTGLFLMWLRCNALYNSSFMNDVKFLESGVLREVYSSFHRISVVVQHFSGVLLYDNNCNHSIMGSFVLVG